MDTQAEQKVVGIDVSKNSLAICHLTDGKTQHLETENNKTGFKQLVKCCGADSLYVMEATGIYYLQLAYYLVEQGAKVVVVNPIIIRRYIQMHLGKDKSDRKDAQWICAMASKVRSNSGSRRSRYSFSVTCWPRCWRMASMLLVTDIPPLFRSRT